MCLIEQKFCECGCGELVRNKFVSGHNSRVVHSMFGKHHKEESKEKNRKAHIGKQLTEEQISNIKIGIQRAAIEGKQIGRQKGYVPWNKGLSKANGDVLSYGRPRSEDACKNISIAMIGKIKSEAHCKNIALSRIGMVASKETVAKMSKSHKGHHRGVGRRLTKEHKENIGTGVKKTLSDPIIRKRLSDHAFLLWENVEWTTKICMARNLRPNKPETVILNLLEDMYPNEWKYTGDFSYMINGKNPDFVNINGKKKIIELFGDYWHQGQNPQDRAEMFKPYGYETLVIWEHELRDVESVKNKLMNFI